MIFICKASAGSGKTHRLTGEYIKFLFRSPADGYKNILAVTFTNKATEEMKQRILQELHLLSSDPGRSAYLKEICEDTGYSPQRVGVIASGILISILHDYSAFRVSTIDKFFQSVMRSFARELGKFASYNVELDTASVIDAAVDKMYSDLEDASGRELLDWLISFSLEQIDEGKNWDVKRKVKSLSGCLFSEEYKIISEGISVQRCDIDGLKKRLEEIIARTENRMRAIGIKIKGLLETYGLCVEDLRGKKGGKFSIFEKLPDFQKGALPEMPKGFAEIAEDPSLWYKASDKPDMKARIIAAYEGGLRECVCEAVDCYEKEGSLYATALLVRRNLNILGIFQDIQQRIDEYCKDRNIILLPQTTELLNRLIADNDAPFIYEKIGASIEHFMLDEFQDTSRLQWKNFYPLLKNSSSQRFENLIVGDVKQSIYRWRGSDWDILNREIEASFAPYELQRNTLDTNWRSKGHIVAFNNAAFDYFARQAQKTLDGAEQGPITEIYSGFRQHLPDGKPEDEGVVEINFIEKKDGESTLAALLPGKIRELLGRGYRRSDIAVLVRTKKEGHLVVDALAAEEYDIISDDSLFLTSSRAVNAVINMLRQVDSPDSRAIEVAGRISDFERITPEQASALQGLSLFEMCRQIIDCCLGEKYCRDVAYLQKLLDIVLDYTVKEGTDLSRFLKWWDSTKDNHTISAPENVDAIRVMTIHKAKGLGFPVVILPFVKEKLVESHTPMKEKRIWCKCHREEIGYNGPLYMDFCSAMENTLFREEYCREKLCSFVDALNVAYVAFTRPEEELIIYAPVPGSGSASGKKVQEKMNSLSDLLYGYCRESLQDYLVQPEESPQVCEGITEQYLIGRKMSVTLRPREISRQLYIEDVFGRREETSDLLSQIKASLNTGIMDEKPSLRDEGIAMHYIFSMIDSRDDILPAVEKAYEEGILIGGEPVYPGEGEHPAGAAERLKRDSRLPETKSRDRVVTELVRAVEKMLDSVESRGWFGNPEYRSLNECNIINPDGSVFRPDRVLVKGEQAVVIDYKFGNYDTGVTQTGGYRRQVKRYMGLLREMGYKQIRGYIWYINARIVEEM